MAEQLEKENLEHPSNQENLSQTSPVKKRFTKFDTKTLTTLALLIALNVILNDGFALQTTLIKINFGFVTLIFAGILFGPWGSVTVAVLGDIIGLMVFPPVGAPNPIFTLITGTVGLIYGLCLYSKNGKLTDKSLMVRSGIAAFLVTQIMYTGVNSYTLGYLYGWGYITALMPMRIFKNIVLFFVNMMIIPVIYETVQRLQKGGVLVYGKHSGLQVNASASFEEV